MFALIAAGKPGDPDTACFPAPLLFALDAQGGLDRTQPLEPLAPDLQKNDRNIVKLKLIAGLLGTPYASLYRRDQRRSRRIAVALGTFAFLLILLLSGLSIAAFTYARMAVQQRNEAQAARKKRRAAEKAAKAMGTQNRMLQKEQRNKLSRLKSRLKICSWSANSPCAHWTI